MLKRALPAFALLALAAFSMPALAQTGAPATKPAAAAAAKPADAKIAATPTKPGADATKAADGAVASTHPKVLIKTSLGDITIELYEDKAPKSVENFLQYAREGFYDGTVFHRVIDGFMVQGGGFTRDLTQKRTRAPVHNEANNGLSNMRGTLAMARTSDPHSATAQFFINVADNKRLDYVSDTNGMTWGYCVFAKVIEGLDVVDKIKAVPTAAQGPLPRDVPTTPVLIEKVEIKQ
jgi:peptidyl-prolyl cis-trans isomerase A (cyclophilin A)/peptidyl-prolyl cis-trans isomerase B (cyclophilin B)